MAVSSCSLGYHWSNLLFSSLHKKFIREDSESAYIDQVFYYVISETMTGKRFNNIGKTVKVSCRVCRIAINGQSYYDHLKAKHPEENPKDRSTYGQKRLVFTAGLLSAGPVLAHPDEPSGRVGDGGGGEQGGGGENGGMGGTEEERERDRDRSRSPLIRY